MKISAGSWAAGALAAVLCYAQAALTNESVVKMVQAGLGEEVVLRAIRNEPGRFATGADDLISLKNAGVPDRIIRAMLDKESSFFVPKRNPPSEGAAAATAPSSMVIAPAQPPVVSEVGVYYNKNGAWADLSPEIVHSKTTGVLRRIGRAGIGKGDVNGYLSGLHSPNSIKPPVELLVYTAEGVGITEYQLLQLREQKGSREFRTATGGVLHSSGGATRDLMQFEGKKVAPRTYLITLPSLAVGEYGLLPPLGVESTGRIGKIYSFRLVP